MSKILRTAALVVGAVALTVATAGIGAAPALSVTTTIGAATATSSVAAISAGIAGISAATLGTIATGLSLASGLLASKPRGSIGGSQTAFKADPNAGIPYAMGRTWVGGNIVFRNSADGFSGSTVNDLSDFVVVLSGAGPVQSIDSFYADRELVSFSGGAAIGKYANFMWQTTQLGASPEASALSRTAGVSTAPAGWASAHKLSGMAAALWTLRFRKEGDFYGNGTPEPGWVGHWVKVYDPRLDSTYPGGSGACRALQESTYVWSDNPYLHALTWCLGRWQNGQRVLGIGAAVAAIDVASFVEGANIAQANGWTMGGVVYSTDGKWNVLKAILQAGGGEPIRLGARISCMINTPRVSLATITAADLADGEVSVAATQSRRNRINRVIPRYRSEAHQWEMIAAAPVSVAAHAATDGGQRTREIEYSLVQNVDQAAQLARYDIENSREFGPITLPLKTRWVGYKPGDCVTVDIPEAGLSGQPVLLLNRAIDPTGGIVTMVARSETAAKHPFALGQTGVAPPTPGVSGPPLVPTPRDSAWAMAMGLTTMTITGAPDDPSIEAVHFEYRPYVDGQGVDDGWINAGVEWPTVREKQITGLSPVTAYQVSIRYRLRGVLGARLLIGPKRSDMPAPADVTGFGIQIIDTAAHLQWAAPQSDWLSHYVIKFQPVQTGASWSSAITLIGKVPIGAGAISVPAMNGTYLIKAVNFDGVESVNAALIVSNVLTLNALNVVAVVDEGPAFAGAVDNLIQGEFGLILSGGQSWDGWADFDAIGDVDFGSGAPFVPEGFYNFANSLDLGDVYTSRLTASITATGIDIRTSFDLVPDVDAMPAWDGADPSAWNIELQVQLSDDAVSYGPWRSFVVGDYTARAFRWRVRLSSNDPYVTPVLVDAAVSVDMPDRTIGAEDVVCPSGGLTVTFANGFRATPAVAITGQGMATGDYAEVTAKSASGFHIQFKNAAGTGVARTFDWIAKGYGVKQ